MALLGAVVFALAYSCTAGAAEAPRCPENAMNSFLAAPGYGRAEEGLELTVYSYTPSRSANVSVTVSSVAGSVTTPVTLTSDKTKLIVTPGPAGSETQAILEWDQDAGTATACRGFDRRIVPIVPRDALVGATSLPRFSGRFRIEPNGAKNPVFWRVQPTCEYFACTVEIRAGKGNHGRFRLNGRGRYEFEQVDPPSKDCVAGRDEKLVARNVYFAHNKFELRVTKEKDDRVTAFTVLVRIIWEPTHRGIHKGCVQRDHEFVRFNGRLAGAG